MCQILSHQPMELIRKIASVVAWPHSDNLLGMYINCVSFLLMAAYVIVLPIPHTIAIRHIVFFSLLLLTLWIAWQQRMKLHLPLAWPWAFYASVASISVIYAIDPFFSLGEVKKEVGFGVIAFLLAVSWVRSIRALSRLLAVIVASSTLMVIYSIGRAIANDAFLTQGLIQEGGVGGVGNLSTYLITVLPFVAVYTVVSPDPHKLKRAILLFIIAIDVVALYLTGNRAGIIALIAEIMLVLTLLVFYRTLPNVKRILVIGLVGLTLLSGVFVKHMHDRNMAVFNNAAEGMSHVSDDPRWTLWRRALQNIQDHPFIGAGFGREVYKLRNPDMPNINDVYWHAHNIILNKGVQMGIPGMLAFLILLSAILYTLWKPAVEGRFSTPASKYALAGIVMLCGVVVKNMTDDFFVHDNALLFWVLVGALIGALSGEKMTNAPRNSQAKL